MMELQLTHRIELMLAEERICLERHEQELAVRRARVLYLESVTSEEAEFQERTDWRKKLPLLPRWPSRRKANKRQLRGADRCADGNEPAPKRMCSSRSKVAGVITSGASAALIRDRFPDQKGVVVSEMAPIPEDLLNVSLEEVIFMAEWAPEVILPDPFPAFNFSQEDIREITPERNPEKLLNPEKVLEPEKEKPAGQRSSCLRSSATRRSKKKKGTRKRRVRTQDMVEEGVYYSDELDPESVEDGCLLLGLSRDVIDLA